MSNAAPTGEGRVFSCPRCGEKVKTDVPHFPFCSKRCRMIDLGTWLEEGFRIDGAHGDNIEDIQ